MVAERDRTADGAAGRWGRIAARARALTTCGPVDEETHCRSVGSSAIELFFKSLSTLGRLHPDSRPERHGIELRANLRYADRPDRAGLLDVYRPRRAKEPRPVVLYLHGGGFRILSKESHWIFALAFARAGYLVLVPNYRLAPAHPFPAAFEDACAAYRWTVEHAADFGGEPRRLVVAGESAGANLATSLALAASFDRPEPFARRVRELGVAPRAVWCGCGILEVTRPERFWEDPRMSGHARDRILAVSYGYVPRDRDDGDRLFFANPLVALESAEEPTVPLPPFFASVGSRDPIVDDTIRLENALARRGVEHEAFYAAGHHHAYQAFVWSKAARETWRETFRFLARHVG